ncbi:MAG TPA: hypothetical protein VFH08_02410 [Chitinophagaceae bacterium]|nr:hypothetical protein [Chitinophagaceae bacterium]
MEVHQHAHTPRKKWTHYFWEFFMLFLAVTLGFLVENWREHLIEKKRADKYLKGVLLDIESNISTLDSLIKENDALKKNYDQQIQRLLNDSSHIDRYAFAKKILPSNIRVFVGRNENFEQMKSSGTLRYIEDEKLLQQILNYQYLSTLATWRSNENERKLFFEQYVPIIQRNFDMECMQTNITKDGSSMFIMKPHIDILTGAEARTFRNEVGRMMLIRTRSIDVSSKTYYQLIVEGKKLAERLRNELKEFSKSRLKYGSTFPHPYSPKKMGTLLLGVFNVISSCFLWIFSRVSART